jgi:hypothetical protein
MSWVDISKVNLITWFLMMKKFEILANIKTNGLSKHFLTLIEKNVV